MKNTKSKTTTTKSKTTKSAAKTKAVKTVKSPVKAVKSPAKSRVTKAAAKKTAARKGPIHHAKRLYHLTPKFVHGMLVGAVVGLALVSWISSTGHAAANPAAASCIKLKGGINVNEKNANTDITMDAGCGVRYFVMKAWYADSASGLPHDTQRLFAQSGQVKVTTRGNDVEHINVNMPASGCFYQVDVVDVTNPASDGNGNPIVASKTGGNHSCNPTPVYSCDSLHASVDTSRQATIDQFNVTARNASFSRATVNWGDGSTPITITNVNGSQHRYSADGNYNISLTAYFNILGQNGQPKEVASPVCVAHVAANTPVVTPGTQQVCQLNAAKVVTIPEGSYDTTMYGPTTSKECNPTITVTSSSSTPAALVNTGPGAVLVILGLAIAGGYVFHRTHHHVKHKKQQHHGPRTHHAAHK